MWPWSPLPPPPPPPEPRDPAPIFAAARERKADKPPELQDQYEDLLNTVWETEARERMNDRIDAAVSLEAVRKKRRRKKA